MAKVVGPNEGKSGPLGAIGVRCDLGRGVRGGFSLVEHPMPARGRATASTQP